MTPTPSSERDELPTRYLDGIPMTVGRVLNDLVWKDITFEEAEVVIHHQTQIAQVRYALEVLTRVKKRALHAFILGTNDQLTWPEIIEEAIKEQEDKVNEQVGFKRT